MRHALIERLIDECGYPEVTLENHESVVGRPGINVLFFAGDPKRYRETTDVAVVLPELVAATDGGLHPGIVAESAEIELQKRYGFRSWPALVFVRPEGYLGEISKMKDWAEYLQEITEIAQAKPRRAPGFKIPVVSA